MPGTDKHVRLPWIRYHRACLRKNSVHLSNGAPMEDPFDSLAAELQTHYRNMQDDLYDGLTPKVVEATNQALAWGQSPANILAHGLVAGMDAVGEGFRRGDPVRAGSPPRGQRDEGRDGDPAPAARRDRRAEGRHRGHRHREGRHPRHRQEPGGHDVGGRRVRGDQPGRQRRRRQVHRGDPTSTTRRCSACRRCSRRPCPTC